MRSPIVLSFLLAAMSMLVAQEQAPSLGDVARKNRRNAPQTATKKKVLVNEDLSTKSSASYPNAGSTQKEKPSEGAGQFSKYALTPEQVEGAKNKIRHLKSRITHLESRRAEINQWKEDRKNEVAYCAPQKQAYGYSACDAVAEAETELQETESKLRSTREELAQLQEKLRQMGYGSSVYDAS